jgi:hypothetical protein
MARRTRGSGHLYRRGATWWAQWGAGERVGFPLEAGAGQGATECPQGDEEQVPKDRDRRDR